MPVACKEYRHPRCLVLVVDEFNVLEERLGHICACALKRLASSLGDTGVEQQGLSQSVRLLGVGDSLSSFGWGTYCLDEVLEKVAASWVEDLVYNLWIGVQSGQPRGPLLIHGCAQY